MTTANSYRLRNFEPSNLGEIERMNLMFYHPAVMEAKGYASSDVSYATKVDLGRVQPNMFDGENLVKSDGVDVSYAIADTDNHLVGWIWFYLDKSHPLPIKVAKYFGLTAHNALMYQLSYEKLMSEGWPAEIVAKLIHVKKEHLTIPRKGVVVQGLKLALKRLQRGFEKVYRDQKYLVLYGFVLPDNIASQKVLEMNDFQKIERMYQYDSIPHQLWVRIIR